MRKMEGRKVSYALKRFIDVLGSVVALVLSSPLFVIIAAAIKLTSEGPVLFRQTRLGQYGKKFTFFKFRSMYAANDHTIHQQFVNNYIAGTLGVEGQHDHRPVYKMTNDPRITRVGKFLRRSSLDEIPQFLNVLWGDMSLVGPRPLPVYEVEKFERWQRRRMTMRPGITCLWQVMGRNRVTDFAEWMKLDLEYVDRWSLGLDLKILAKTIPAVLLGKGAY
jgi:exopolysaccharide biosynthesis polyprenyl glycosylphosphotransferase